MSEKSTKKSKKHRKSGVSERDGQEPASESKPEPEDAQDVTPDVSNKGDVRKGPKGTKDDDMLNESAVPAADLDATQTKPKKSKQQKRTEGNEVLDGGVTPDAYMHSKPKKSKKRKHTEGDKTREASAIITGADVIQPQPEKSKKQKRTDDEEQLEGSTTHLAQDAMQPKPKKSKKRKQAEGDEGGDESTNPDAGADTQPKPKKSKKRREGHNDDAKHHPSSDPSNDESLAEQSRKALAYAYERFEAPETWKFNKARQNWLLRNFWSEKAIPENYIPLVVKYFAELKGGSREKLIEACNSKSAAAASAETVSGNPELADEPATTDRSGSRAQLLLQSLQST